MNNTTSSTSNARSPETVSTTNTRKGVEEQILRHAKDKFSLDPDKVTIKEITSLDLPAGVQYYYLEKKGSYGHDYFNYFVFNNSLFCSRVAGDFEKFLKAIDFLTGKNLSATRFWNIFQQLKFDNGQAVLIDERLISQPFDILKPVLNQLSPPKLEYKDNMATFNFCAVDMDNQKVRKYTVNIAPDYKVSIDSVDLKAA